MGFAGVAVGFVGECGGALWGDGHTWLALVLNIMPQDGRRGFYFGGQLGLIALLFWVDADLLFNFWMLALPLVAQSLALPRQGTAVLITLILAMVTLVLRRAGADWGEVAQSMTGMGAAMGFVLVFTYVAVRENEARTEIERLATALQTANEQLRTYAVQVEELATTKERNRLAREIHDSLGHYLTVIHMQLNAAQAVLPVDQEKGLTAVNRAQSLAQEGLTEVRRSVAALREAPERKRPLPEAIQILTDVTSAAGIKTTLQVQGIPHLLPSSVAHTLYRVAQEGLTNARKPFTG